MGLTVSFTSRTLYWQENISTTCWTEDFVGPWSGLDVLEMRNILSLVCIELRFLGYPAHSLTLYRLYYCIALYEYNGRLFPRRFQCICRQCMPILTERGGRESDTFVRVWRSRIIRNIGNNKKKPCLSCRQCFYSYYYYYYYYYYSSRPLCNVFTIIQFTWAGYAVAQ
jgi:hypothetical protein